MSSLLLRHHRISLRFFLRHSNHRFSTLHPPPQPEPLDVPLSHPAYLIWSANTSLGKTLVSAGLSSSFLLSSWSSSKKLLYLKPVQTGFPSDSDSRFVFNKLFSLSLRRKVPLSLILSNSVLNSSISAAKSLLLDEFQLQEKKCGSGLYELNFHERKEVLADDDSNVVSELVCKTLFAWKEAVSPHLVAERESGVVADSVVVETLGKYLREEMGSKRERMEELCLVETAGGVASPGPSGTLQCDLYRPLRFPSILVGDGRLGGISATIAAYETLKLRGYDVVAVIFEDHGLVNEVPLMSYFRSR